MPENMGLMPNQTLIEKAKQVVVKRKGFPYERGEMLDLALAYINREITVSQARIATGLPGSGGNVISKMASALISAARNGVIRVERVK